ncbi:MAG TPA: DUF3426 domain-containing protein [Xanthomonadaceae bacterium]|nr:DUF3426 domain-containing protein [Xanthomonadaceae bacterium]
MFTLCPHCQFLVALDPATGRAPADCPRCGKPLTMPATDDHGADETATQAMPAQDGQAPPADAVLDVAPPATSDEAKTPPAASAFVGEEARPRRARAARSRTTTAAPPPATDASGEAPVAAPADTANTDAGATTGPTIAEAASRDDAPTAPTSGRDETRMPGPAAAGEAASAADVPDMPVAADDITEAAPAEESAGPDAQPVPRRHHLPSFAHPLRTPAVRPGGRTVAAIAGLALLLVLQLLLADRARLAGDARWRPLLSTLCGALRCELPAWREPTAFTLLARDVRPARQGVLHVTATFRNDARWPQPWPAVRLALQDVDGRTVGARTLRPDEYHPRTGEGARITQSGLAPGQSARIAFDIVEPAGTAVAFTFDFR